MGAHYATGKNLKEKGPAPSKTCKPEFSNKNTARRTIYYLSSVP
jgi:hypothetical protein